MSDFQEQKEQYKLPSDLIEEFLSVHEFIGIEIDYIRNITILENKTLKRCVKIPTKRVLNHAQIEKCLADAGLTFDDLNSYIEHLKAIRQFDDIIKLSLSRDSAKIKDTEN